MKIVNRFMLLSCCFLLGFLTASGQDYSLSSSDYPAVGTTSVMQTDSTGHAVVNVGSPGKNQNWSPTQTLKGGTIPYNCVAPGAAFSGAPFTKIADWAIQTKQWLAMDPIPPVLLQPIRGYFDIAYFEKLKSDTVQGVGIGIVTPVYSGGYAFVKSSANFTFPLAYGKKWLKKARYIPQVQIIFAGQTIKLNADTRDSTWIEVDGTGKLTLPLGTFDCVRLKHKRHLAMNFLLGTTSMYSTKDTLLIYEWYTKKAGLLLQIISHDGEKNENFTDASYVAQLSSSSAITAVDCGPDCRTASEVPTGYVLGQNYPNPFNPSTRIPYTLETPAHVDIRVYTLLGREVAILESGVQSAGRHETSWSGKDQQGTICPGALYFCRMKTMPVSGGQTAVQTRKMLLTD